MVEGGLVDLLSFGLLSSSDASSSAGDPARSLRLAINRLCQELLPNAIGLSDAFAFTDWELDRYVPYFLSSTCETGLKCISALGVFDGKVYDALWARAQTEPLNQLEVTTAYEVGNRYI